MAWGGVPEGPAVQCSELHSLPLSSRDGDGRVEAKDGSARGLADSLLIRDLGSWLLPFIVSQALYELHCLHEPHNRSCKLGSPESTPVSRVLQMLSPALWARPLWLLFRREPFLWIF